MEQDLADLKSGKLKPPMTATPVQESVFPLPPMTKNQKVVMSPEIPRRPMWWGWWGWLGLAVVGLVAAAGGWWWLIGFEGGLSGGAVATAAEIIPVQHALVVAYPALSDETRSLLQARWETAAKPAGVGSLLNGDPRWLLTEADNTLFFFVMLPGEVRPYLVIPKTNATSKLLDGTQEGQVTLYKGWYVAHALDTKPYLTALAAGTASVQTVEQLAAAPTDQTVMRWWMKSGAFQQTRVAVARRPWAKAPLEEAILAFSLPAEEKSLMIGGNSPQLSLSPATYQPALLNIVPSDASLVHAGGNLKEAVERWQTAGGALSAERLERPLVKQLLDKLTGPYVFYYRLGADAVPDVGLIIDLAATPDLVASLLGDAGVEAALPSWLNLLLDNPPMVDLIFTQRDYNGTLLKYVNVQGPELALDYAVIGNYLVAASSREGMLKVLDIISQREAVGATTDGQGWRDLVTAWGDLPTSEAMTVTKISYPPFRALLPPGNETVTVGLTMAAAENGGATINGRLQY